MELKDWDKLEVKELKRLAKSRAGRIEDLSIEVEILRVLIRNKVVKNVSVEKTDFDSLKELDV